MNEIIVQVSHDTGACYGISKSVEIVLEPGKIVREERLAFLDKRMEIMDPDEFLGVEQTDGIKTKVVFKRVKSKV